MNREEAKREERDYRMIVFELDQKELERRLNVWVLKQIGEDKGEQDEDNKIDQKQ